MLWELGGGFFDPFCHSAETPVCVVEDASLLAQRLVHVLGISLDLAECGAEFTYVGEYGEIAPAGGIKQGGQDHDDNTADK